MQTIGFIGVGNIGMVICKHLIDSGHKVLGYRRSSLAEFEKIGGITAKSPADVSSQADIVFSCLPGGSALDEVVTGPNGLLKNARRGQVVVELGSHPIAAKERQVARFAEKGVAFIDGEVSGTPGIEAGADGQDICRCMPLSRYLWLGQQDQIHQQSAGHRKHRGHRRGHRARP